MYNTWRLKKERIIHRLESIGRVSGIEFAVLREDQVTPIFGMGKGNPIVTSPQMRNRLLTKSREQDPPLIAPDPHGVADGCVQTREAAFLFGPMPIKSISRMEVQAYCVYYIERPERIRDFCWISVACALSPFQSNLVKRRRGIHSIAALKLP